MIVKSDVAKEAAGEQVASEPRQFATTCWSLILSAAKSETGEQNARDALEELCRTYWRPIFSFVCRRGYSMDDAQDLTQDFFVKIGSFAGAALFLATAGLYAVISYGIQQRTQEIGVRLALGATHGSILRMIFKEGSLPLGTGIAAGLVIALVGAKLVANQMYGVCEHDPFSFLVVSLLLAAISLLACWIAARRALNVDPVVALRAE